VRRPPSEPHGSIFEFYRDRGLNANDAINELRGLPKSPYHYNQFGGTAGGPIRHDRDFFFFNYDGQRNTQPNLVFLNLPSNTPTDPLTQQAIAALQPKAASWTRTLNQDVFLIKTDDELTNAHRLSLRYNHQKFQGNNFENGGPQNSVEHTGASTFPKSVVACARGGRIVTCGATDGYEATLNLRHVFWRHLSILGSTLAPKSCLFAIVDRLAAGQLKAVIDRVLPLAEIQDAHRVLEARQAFGKIVMTLE